MVPKKKSSPLGSLTVMLMLVGLGIATRFLWADIPNFKPLGGIALFAGFYFTRYSIAATVPITILCVSDWWLGGYQPLLKLAVYGSLITPIFLRGVTQSAVHRIGSGRSAATGALILGGCAGGSSLLFFVTTNFATWLVTPWYAKTWQGAVDCFVAALPFLQYTMAGDLIFTGILFGGYLLVYQKDVSVRPAVSYSR
jgi:hypothetical protein